MDFQENIEKDQLWKLSSPIVNKGGRPVLFKTPKELYEKSIAYFAWVDSHPWQDKDASNGKSECTSEGVVRGTNNSVRQNVRVLRKPYSLYGFCAYANISSKWADFKRNYIEKNGFLEVITWIENIITAEQVEGAMLHKYDSNIVSRLNGIADTTKTEITGKDGEPFMFPKLTPEDIETIIKANNNVG